MDDLISRKKAIDETWKEPSYTDPWNVLTEFRERLKAIPSAEPKKGKWIVHRLMDKGRVELECPKCGDTFVKAVNYKPHFCEYCGADMREE